MTTGYYQSADAEHRAKATAREVMREVEEIEAANAARSARLTPYRRRLRFTLAVKLWLTRRILSVARHVRSLAAAIRRRTGQAHHG